MRQMSPISHVQPILPVTSDMINLPASFPGEHSGVMSGLHVYECVFVCVANEEIGLFILISAI